MGNITEYLNKIKTAIYGKEVRGAMHDAIKQVYDDAAQSGNANMEVVLARGTEPNLNARLGKMDEVSESNTAQLVTLDNKKADNDFVTTLFNSVSGSGPRDVYYTLEALKSAFPNGTTGLYLVLNTDPENPHKYAWSSTDKDWLDLGVYQWDQVPDNSLTTNKYANNSITNNKANFISKSMNLFNMHNINNQDSMDILYNGETQANSLTVLTDYIEINANAYYSITKPGRSIAFYNAQKEFISGIDVSVVQSTFQTPSNACYMRTAFYKTSIHLAMIVKGTTLPTNYVPYFSKIVKDDKTLSSVVADNFTDDVDFGKDLIKKKNLEFLKLKNLFDKSKATLGVWMTNSGNTASNADQYTSDYIEIEPDTTYIRNTNGNYAFFDENKIVIEGHDENNGGKLNPFTTPPNAKYVRFSGWSAYDLQEGYLIKGDTKPSMFIPYGYSISHDIVTSHQRWGGKTWLSVGDSYTAAGRYQIEVARICGFEKVKIDGVVGRMFSDFTQNITAEVLDDVDVLTIMGGANNFQGLRLGTIDDTPDSGTWYGMIKLLIDHILTLKPSVRLVFITQSRYYASQGANINGVTQEMMANAMKETCQYYSIPVIDVFSKCGFNTYTESVYMSGDKLHPNNIGYKKIGEIIGEELNKL